MITTETMTDRQEEIADAIGEYLEAHAGQDFNRSQLARVARCDVLEAGEVLDWMIRSAFVARTGRGGCWIRFAHYRDEAGRIRPSVLSRTVREAGAR